MRGRMACCQQLEGCWSSTAAGEAGLPADAACDAGCDAGCGRLAARLAGDTGLLLVGEPVGLLLSQCVVVVGMMWGLMVDLMAVALGWAEEAVHEAELLLAGCGLSVFALVLAAQRGRGLGGVGEGAPVDGGRGDA